MEFLLTQQQAAEKLAMKSLTLAKWRLRRKGPPWLKLGGKVRYRLTDIDKFISQGFVDPATLKPARGRSGRGMKRGSR